MRDDAQRGMITNVRLLPAAAALVLLVAPAAQARQHVGLAGQVTGTVTDQPQAPDVPTEHDLTGAGRTNLGPTALHGAIAGTGFVQYGTCSGRLVLRAASGTLTLSVGSARMAGFQECPTALTWRITGSSGALAGSTGSGTMHLTSGSGRFRLVFDGPGTPPPALASTGPGAGLQWTGAALLLAAAASRRFRAGSAAPPYQDR